MREFESVFLVVCREQLHGLHLGEMVEFLDVLPVRVSGPTEWVARLGACRPVATFLGSDLEADDVNGIIEQLREIDASSPIVIFSGDDGKTAEAAQSVHSWANIFALRFPAGFDEFDRVLGEIWSLRRRNRKSDTAIENSRDLLGESPQLQAIRTQIDQVAPTASTVLLNGESGTGKEVVARRIH
jgi:DNA-binding NtrC family response regulator